MKPGAVETMVFKATDPKSITGSAPGDKGRLTADRANGALTVTAIESINRRPTQLTGGNQ